MLASETPGEDDAFSGAVSAHGLTFDRLEAMGRVLPFLKAYSAHTGFKL